MKKAFLFLFVFAITLEVSAQYFRLPPRPVYDSVKNKFGRKYFYLKGKLVFYRQTAFFSGRRLDSTLIYNYDDHFDLYSFAETHVDNERYSYVTNIFDFRRFNYFDKTLAEGKYYRIKDIIMGPRDSRRYRIGKWLLQPNKWQPHTTIDYDQLIVDGEKLKFVGNKALVAKAIAIADKKLKQVYGSKFVKKHVKFNLALSKFITEFRGSFPSGGPLISKARKKVIAVDLVYDLVVADRRFNIIKFRVDKEGNILGKSTNYSGRATYLTQGLDMNNKGKLHPSVINWRKTAKKEGFDVLREFNVRVEWKHRKGLDGELKMVMEQTTSTKRTRRSMTKNLKQVYINLWTGAKEEKKGKTGISAMD